MHKVVYAQHAANEPVSLHHDRLLYRKVNLPEEHLCAGMEVLFATHKRVLSGTLDIRVALMDVSGEETHEDFVVDMHTIADNSYVRLELPAPVLAKYLGLSAVACYDDPGKDSGALAIWSSKDDICCKVLSLDKDFLPPVTNGPLISVLVPCHNTPLEYLEDAVASVMAQTYGNWELVLVDDGSSPSSGVPAYLARLSLLLHPKKLTVFIRSSKGGISCALNTAKNRATGEWFVVLDHDDTLNMYALEHIAANILKDPDVDLIYTDEDKILSGSSKKGTLLYGDTFRKPDWSPTLFQNQMYINHLTALRMTSMQWDPSYDGAQDYEYVLRYLRQNKGTVKHIPNVLYHWRVHPDSTAAGMDVKPAASRNAMRAIKQDLHHKGHFEALVTTTLCQGAYEVHRKPSRYPSVAVIIPSKDKVQILSSCLESVSNSSYPGPLEVIVVDSGSEEGTTASYYEMLLATYPLPIKVVESRGPFNFSSLVNAGAEDTEADILVLLNNDTQVITADWLERMVQQFDDINVGAVGAMLLYPDNTVQHAGVQIGRGGVAGHVDSRVSCHAPGYFSRLQLEREVECVTAACLAVRSSLYKEVGGFEVELPEAFNDVDFCLKVRQKGLRIIYTPHAKLYHYESLSRGSDVGKPSFALACSYMKDKWGTERYVDPYYRGGI